MKTHNNNSFRHEKQIKWEIPVYFSLANRRNTTNMNKERNSNGMSRRQFLQTSAELAASAMFLSLGSAQSFAAPNTSTQENSIPLVTLNNGLQMPRLGLGTMTLNGDVGIRCVADAISLGYRLIDTAMIYNTESGSRRRDQTKWNQT